MRNFLLKNTWITTLAKERKLRHLHKPLNALRISQIGKVEGKRESQMDTRDLEQDKEKYSVFILTQRVGTR